MGTGALIGVVLSFAVGVAQLLGGDWSGGIWTMLGVGLMSLRRQWR